MSSKLRPLQPANQPAVNRDGTLAQYEYWFGLDRLVRQMEAQAGSGGVPTTRLISAGNGLTGGGDLSADRVLNVGAGTGIQVNADSVEVKYGTAAGTAAQGNDARIVGAAQTADLGSAAFQSSSAFDASGAATAAVSAHVAASDPHPQYLTAAEGNAAYQPLVSGFMANKNSTSQGSIPASTATKITFTNELYDAGGYYDATNSKWTPPAGLISLAVGVRIEAGLVDGSIFSLSIRKNGSLYVQNRATVTGAANSEFTAFLVAKDQANGTDYYEVFVNVGGTGDKTASGLNSATFFAGSTG